MPKARRHRCEHAVLRTAMRRANTPMTGPRWKSANASSAPVGLLLAAIGGGRLVGQTVRQLLLDLDEILGLRLEVPGVRPLEFRLKRAPGLGIGVAEMVVDGRIVGLELDRALQVLHRFVVVAGPEI